MLKKMPLFVLVMAVLVVFGVLLCAMPKREFSELENRRLSALPSAQNGALSDGTFGEGLETYAADHFPLRDAFISLRAFAHLASGDVCLMDTLYGQGGWLFEQAPKEATRTALLSVETLDEIADALDVPSYLMLIPTSSAVMARALPPLYACENQQAVMDALYAQAAEMTCVDTTLFAHEGDEGLYYRTDHHLTAEGAAICYSSLCGALGLTPQTDFVRFETSGFLGSYYAKMPSFTVAAEDFSVYMAENIRVIIDGREAEGILDTKALSGRGKYAALLGETYGHATLENSAGSGSLLIIADSYANAIAPMLAAHYRRVDLVDPRYLTEDLKQLAMDAGTDTMLALFGLNTISANRSVLLMDVPEGK